MSHYRHIWPILATIATLSVLAALSLLGCRVDGDGGDGGLETDSGELEECESADLGMYYFCCCQRTRDLACIEYFVPAGMSHEDRDGHNVFFSNDPLETVIADWTAPCRHWSNEACRVGIQCAPATP